jgi:hypothetical protein
MAQVKPISQEKAFKVWSKEAQYYPRMVKSYMVRALGVFAAAEEPDECFQQWLAGAIEAGRVVADKEENDG